MQKIYGIYRIEVDSWNGGEQLVQLFSSLDSALLWILENYPDIFEKYSRALGDYSKNTELEKTVADYTYFQIREMTVLD